MDLTQNMTQLKMECKMTDISNLDTNEPKREWEFKFTKEYDGTLSIESAVFQALGFASVCWTGSPQGIFKSDECKSAGDALVEFIKNLPPQNFVIACGECNGKGYTESGILCSCGNPGCSFVSCDTCMGTGIEKGTV